MYFNMRLNKSQKYVENLGGLGQAECPLLQSFQTLGFCCSQADALLFRSLGGGECSGKFISYKEGLIAPQCSPFSQQSRSNQGQGKRSANSSWQKKNKESHCCPFLLLATFGARVPLDDEGKVLWRNHGHITGWHISSVKTSS